jgi:hypothetical protein
MRFLPPPHQWFLKLTFLKIELLGVLDDTQVDNGDEKNAGENGTERQRGSE